MKRISLAMILAASAAAVFAQSAAKPATTAKPATAGTPAGVKLPPGIPPARGLVKTAFSLRYQDIKIGTGAEAEPNKMYKVLYTGWLASDGHKFDSSDDHRFPVLDKNGKPVLGDDGKPKLGDPQPMNFPQGFGRLIPGFDQGFGGMKVGGKRRLFIPWQLAYGARGRPGPDPAHPGIPPKADLIFDVELVEVTDMPMPQNRPMMPQRPNMPGVPPRQQPANPGAPNPGSAPGTPGAQPGGQATPPPTQTTPPPAASTPATPPSATQPAAPAEPAKPNQSTAPQSKQ
jgi:peptidylprolyl isomerase